MWSRSEGKGRVSITTVSNDDPTFVYHSAGTGRLVRCVAACLKTMRGVKADCNVAPGVGTPATRIRGPSAAGRAMSAPAPAMTDMTPGAAPSSGRLPQTPFRTPFRTPFFKAVEKGRSGPILVSRGS